MGHQYNKRSYKKHAKIKPMLIWYCLKSSIRIWKIHFHMLSWTPCNRIVWCLPLSLMNVTIIKFLFSNKLICYWHFIITWQWPEPSFLHPPPPGSCSKNLSVHHLLQLIIHQLSPDTPLHSRNMIHTNCHQQNRVSSSSWCWSQDFTPIKWTFKQDWFFGCTRLSPNRTKTRLFSYLLQYVGKT